jgi:hypothetical protein
MKTKFLVIKIFILIAISSNVAMGMEPDPLKEKLGNLKGSLQALKTKLGILQGKLGGLQDRLEVQLPLELRRRYKPDDGSWKRLPIRFYKEDMLSDKYANKHCYKDNSKVETAQINIKEINDPEKCQAVGGPFTYYDAIPSEFNTNDADLYHDGGWGCAWRATLNVLNSVKEWLEKRGIYAKGDLKNRQFNMQDIKVQFVSDYGSWPSNTHARWLEPAENAELFLRFIETYYEHPENIVGKSHDDTSGILGLRGRFYSSLSPSWKNIKLTKLTAYYGGTYADIHKNFYENCGSNSNVEISKFPQFGDSTDHTPFPLNVDDGTWARNFYGIYAENRLNPEENIVTHIFVGETHAGKVLNWQDSPWMSSGWLELGTIFNGRNVMMLEIYVK